MTGEWAYVVGLGVIAFRVAGVGGVGFAVLIRMIPAALATPFVAAVGDRYPRKQVLVVSSLARATVIGSVGLALLMGAPSWVVFAGAGVLAPIWTLTRPAYAALLPMLARSPHELAACNVATTAIENASMVTGPSFAALLLSLERPGLVFLFSAAAFAWCAYLGHRLPIDAPAHAGSTSSLVRASFEGVSALWRRKQARLLIGLYSAQTLVRGTLNVLVVVIALNLLSLGRPGVGTLNSAIGIGGFLGALVTLSIVGQRGVVTAFIAGVTLWSVPLVAIGVWPTALAAVLLMVLIGSANALIEVAGVTALQRAIPGVVLGRVLALLEGSIMLSLGLGAILAPILVDLVGIRVALMITGTLVPLLGLASWSRLRGFETTATVSRSMEELLMKVEIFEPLPLRVIDQLAARATRIELPEGETVFRQGDRGDLFYVIAEGRVHVQVDGTSARSMGPGEAFGEIALLRDVPRTATVTATTAIVLYAVERDEFIGAVAGHAASSHAAESVVTSRLENLRPGLASI